MIVPLHNSEESTDRRLEQGGREKKTGLIERKRLCGLTGKKISVFMVQ